jgi:hypothetical protein
MSLPGFQLKTTLQEPGAHSEFFTGGGGADAAAMVFYNLCFFFKSCIIQIIP